MSSPVKRDSSGCGNLPAMSSATSIPPEDQSPVPSPCINLCQISPQTGLCLGCMRTIDEIIAWGAADEDAKRAVWRDIRRREAQIAF
jgi:predicted Fe-S protein YdhL (DUF1289 family)